MCRRYQLHQAFGGLINEEKMLTSKPSVVLVSSAYATRCLSHAVVK